MEFRMTKNESGTEVGANGNFVAWGKAEDGTALYRVELDNRKGWDGATFRVYYGGENGTEFSGNIWNVPDFISYLQQAWEYKKQHEQD